MFCWIENRISTDCGECWIHVLAVQRLVRRRKYDAMFVILFLPCEFESVRAQYPGSTPWFCIMQGSSSRGKKQRERTDTLDVGF
jgi:hypothetical protein